MRNLGSPGAYAMKMWNVAAKVPDVDREIAFIQAVGGELVLDNILEVEGRNFRVVLMKWGDKYLAFP